MAEYRPVPADRDADFRRIARYAFDAGTGPHDPEEPPDERRRRMYSFGESRGMYDGDELLVVCHHIPFTVRVRGAWVPMVGLSAVASPPENRRQGLVGELMAASLAEFRDREWPVSALLPFDEAFYARYGWATGCRRHVATVDVDALSVAQDAAAGSFRRIDPADGEYLAPVYEAWLDGVNLATRRSPAWWRDRVFQATDTELYGYAWERDGEPRGYLIYGIDGDDEPTLTVHEFAHVDHEAYLNLLRFCHDHDSQVDAVELHGPGHDRLLDVVPGRDAVEVEVAPGPMVRLVDVPAALEAIEYPDVEDAHLTVAVTDDHAPWNEATFEVAVGDDTATVSETDAVPGATVDVGTLAQLFVGYYTVAQVRTLGDLRIDGEDAASTLEALFPAGEPFLPEEF